MIYSADFVFKKHMLNARYILYLSNIMGKHTKLQQPEERERPKRSIWKFLLFTLLIAIIIAIAGLVYIYKTTPKDIRDSFADTISFVTNPGQTVFGDKDSVNILCLGLDYNYTNEGIIFSKNARTDTIFIINVNKDGKINILSVPRDLRVEIPGYGMDKVNAAYALGEEPLARQTIENFLGIKIDYYAVIRIKGTKELIDALGGITVDVEKDIDYDDNWGHTHIHLKKGLQKLNGDEAVGYSRFRYDEEGDRGRIRRQQQVLKALVFQLKDPRNITKVNEITRAFKNNIETSFTFTQLIDFARLYKKFTASNIHTDKLEGADEDIGGISYMVPDENDRRIKVNRMFLGIVEYLPGEVSVNVFNATEKPGLARKLADKLSSAGYGINKVGDYKEEHKDAEIPKLTQVVIKKSTKKEAAGAIVRAIGTGQIIEQIDEASPVDFEIDICEDLLPYMGEEK